MVIQRPAIVDFGRGRRRYRPAEAGRVPGRTDGVGGQRRNLLGDGILLIRSRTAVGQDLLGRGGGPRDLRPGGPHGRRRYDLGVLVGVRRQVIVVVMLYGHDRGRGSTRAVRRIRAPVQAVLL